MLIYGVVIDEIFQGWRAFEELPPHRDRSLRPQVVDPEPAFDPATQTIEPGDPIVEPEQVRFTWRVRALTAEELDEKEQRAIFDQARAVYSALKNGNGTNDVRLRRIEGVLAYLVKEHAKSLGLPVT